MRGLQTKLKKNKNRSPVTPLLLNAYNYALDTGKLAKIWPLSIIILIFKEEKDTSTGPCTGRLLLNTDSSIDSKILVEILANRLKLLLQT